MEQAGIEAFVERWESLPIWESQARLSAEQRLRLRRQRLAENVKGLSNSLRGVGLGAQPAMHHRLGELQAPTLFISGEEDTKFVAIAKQMSASVPDGHLQIVKQSGHAVHLEQPEIFNRTVLDFVRSVDASLEFSQARSGSQQRH